MKEFKNDSASAVARFGRDRRTHTADGASEHAERHPRSQREAAGSDRTPYAGKRASFNPNFTADNRPAQQKRRGLQQAWTKIWKQEATIPADVPSPNPI